RNIQVGPSQWQFLAQFARMPYTQTFGSGWNIGTTNSCRSSSWANVATRRWKPSYKNLSAEFRYDLGEHARTVNLPGWALLRIVQRTEQGQPSRLTQHIHATSHLLMSTLGTHRRR